MPSINISDEDCGGGGSSSPVEFKYTNANPMSTKVGGWNAGSTFNALALKDLLDGLLYDYLNPTFSSFSIIGQVSPLEVGNTILAGNKTFTWGTTNSANVKPNTISIVDVTNGNTLLGSLLANDGNEVLNLANDITKNIASNHVFRISGTNTNDVAIGTRDYTISWQWRMWWGFNSLSTITSSDILTLSQSRLVTSKSQSITMPTNGSTSFLYFAYPSSFGLLTTIFDATNSFNATNDFNYVGIVSHTNSFGITNDYHLYRSKNSTGGASGFVYNLS